MLTTIPSLSHTYVRKFRKVQLVRLSEKSELPCQHFLIHWIPPVARPKPCEISKTWQAKVTRLTSSGAGDWYVPGNQGCHYQKTDCVWPDKRTHCGYDHLPWQRPRALWMLHSSTAAAKEFPTRRKHQRMVDLPRTIILEPHDMKTLTH